MAKKFDYRGWIKKNKFVLSADRKNVELVTEIKSNLMKTRLNEAKLDSFVKKTLDQQLDGIPKKSPEFQWFIKEILKGALTDANFHSESKKVDSIFPQAKLGTYKVKNSLTGTESMAFKGKEKYFSKSCAETGVEISKKAKWDGHDILDAFSLYVGKNINAQTAYKITQLKDGN